jgi:hypothetical protein
LRYAARQSAPTKDMVELVSRSLQRLPIAQLMAFVVTQSLVSAIHFGFPCSTFSVLDVTTAPGLSVAVSSSE